MSHLLIADGHSLYRKGLRGALESLIAEAHVVEVNSLAAAREHLDPDGHLDLLLVDLDTPGASLEQLRAMHESHPKTRIAAMASLATRADILHSLDAGLHGLISKSQPDSEILGAIQDILSGRIYVPTTLAEIDAALLDADKDERQNRPVGLVKTDMRVEKLTRRQREILPLLAKGMSNKEIARALKIAEGTTKIHASSLLRVLGVRNRTEAAVVARTSYLSGQPIEPATRRR